MDRPRVVPRHGCVLLGSEVRDYASVDHTLREVEDRRESNPSGRQHRMNEELSAEVGEIMRKLVALTAAAVVATALVGGPALADVPTKAKPPVTLQGKVNNKSTATVKKGRPPTSRP